MGEQRRWRRFPNPHFLLAGCFFFLPPLSLLFPVGKKKMGGNNSSRLPRGGKKRGSWVGGKKTAAIAGPWGGGEGGAFRFRSHILPLDACASSAVYWCMIKTPPIFSNRERKKRGEREEKSFVYYLCLFFSCLFSLCCDEWKEGLRGTPEDAEKGGKREKSMSPAYYTFYVHYYKRK